MQQPYIILALNKMISLCTKIISGAHGRDLAFIIKICHTRIVMFPSFLTDPCSKYYMLSLATFLLSSFNCNHWTQGRQSALRGCLVAGISQVSCAL